MRARFRFASLAVAAAALACTHSGDARAAEGAAQTGHTGALELQASGRLGEGAGAATPPSGGQRSLDYSPRLLLIPSLGVPTPSPLTLAEAVRRVLAANPAVLISAQQVRANEGAVEQARGAYDPELVGRATTEGGPRPMRRGETASLAGTGSTPLTVDRSDSTTYGASVEQTLASGARIEAGLNVTSASSDFNLAQGTPRQTAGGLRFSLRVPLQRNAGGIQQSSTLEASELERDASVEDLVQTSAATVVNLVQAYWELAARLGRLEILRESEARAEALLAELRKLVEADQIPAADLNLAEANLAEKRVARAAEEQFVQQAWAALSRLLFTDAEEALAAQPALQDFPEVSGALAQALRTIGALRADSIERRPDLRAARLRERAAQVQLLGARDTLKPQVDLIFGASTNALAEGASAFRLTDALGRNIAGPTLNVGVEMRWPYRNSAAVGQVQTRAAARDQATLRLRELENGVGSTLVTLGNAIARNVVRHRETDAAVARYTISLQHERTKRRLGQSTLIDVINVQDRLDAARLSLLNLRQEYATLLAQIAFETGELIRRGDAEFSVDVQRLLGAVGGAVRR